MPHSNTNDYRAKFPSFIVEPINDIKEAIARGHYTPSDPTIYGTYFFVPLCYRPSLGITRIMDRTGRVIKLPNAKGAKRVFIVSFKRPVGKGEYVTLLAQYGLRPCKNSPSYLAGLMATVSEAEMPEELRNTDIVAAEPKNHASIFKDDGGHPCFLYVRQRDLAIRDLDLVRISHKKEWLGYWAFLAEEKRGLTSQILSTFKG